MEIDNFGCRCDVPSDGQCGFKALAKSLILAIKADGGSDTVLERWDRQGFTGMNFFRQSLKLFYDEKYTQIIDQDDPLFLDDKGHANPIFKVRYRDGEIVKNCVKYDGTPCNLIDSKADRIHNPAYWQELLESRSNFINQSHWMEPNLSLFH